MAASRASLCPIRHASSGSHSPQINRSQPVPRVESSIYASLLDSGFTAERLDGHPTKEHGLAFEFIAPDVFIFRFVFRDRGAASMTGRQRIPRLAAVAWCCERSAFAISAWYTKGVRAPGQWRPLLSHCMHVGRVSSHYGRSALFSDISRLRYLDLPLLARSAA